jgi:hypothetical protein
MRFFISIVMLLCVTRASAELLISEIAPNASGGDWAEICLNGTGLRQDVSRLYVTVYYGAEEPLAQTPVTMYSEDDPATPWDDRYAVIHFASSLPDETDALGDVNGNGIRDIYVAVGTAPWNTSSVLAIDNDADPANGMIDFLVYTNDSSATNSTVTAYTTHAIAAGAWTGGMISIPTRGIAPYQSLARGGGDSNTAADFAITAAQTPGRPNRVSEGPPKRLLRVPGRCVISADADEIDLEVLAPCTVLFRIYRMDGRLLFRGSPATYTLPGTVRIRIPRLRHGLHVGFVSARALSGGSAQTAKFCIIIGGNR